MFVCLRYSLLTSYNNMSRIPRVQQGGLHLHYIRIYVYFQLNTFFTRNGHGFLLARRLFAGRKIDTMSKRGERPSLRFPHISHFHSATTLAFAAKRGGHRKRKKTRMERKKRAERITPNAPVCVFASLSLFPSNLFFSRVPSRRPRRFSPDFPRMRGSSTPSSHRVRSCFNRVAVSSGTILSKIRFEHTSS